MKRSDFLPDCILPCVVLHRVFAALSLACLVAASTTPAVAQTFGIRSMAQLQSSESPLDYQLHFVPVRFDPNEIRLPPLQSYAHAIDPKSGDWVLIGGRTEGLHAFGSGKPGVPPKNFRKFSDHWFVVNPDSLDVWSLPTDSLPPEIRDPLTCTNPQEHYDAETDTLLIVGGYGKDTQTGKMTTFNTITALKLSPVIDAIKGGDPSVFPELIRSGAIRQTRDDRLAVTGGGLGKMNGRYYLVFGQNFQGSYVFDGASDAVQEYTEKVSIFLLDEAKLEITVFADVASQDTITHPFHRRDLNVIGDVNPSNGETRIAVFGGVFPPGMLSGYKQPLYIDHHNDVDLTEEFEQEFNQYECGIVSVYSQQRHETSRTFFGGISAASFDPKTARATFNDGMPWSNLITRVVHSTDRSGVSTFREYVMPDGIPEGKYLGAEARFFPSQMAREIPCVRENGVIELDAIEEGQDVMVGYIFGGIESSGPQQEKNADGFQGTRATNALFEVHLVREPTPAIAFSTK